MTTKHTPGPWRQGENHPNNACTYIVDNAGLEICTLYGLHDEARAPDEGECWAEQPIRDATARLIAAAPETAAERDRLREENAMLLEALKECTSPIAGYAIKNEAQALEVLSDFLDHIRKVDAIARAAIAKAEGRS